MKKFTADFETCTWKDDESWVWAWAVCDIESEEITIDNKIESFMTFCYENKNTHFYFHNLKFDGSFIIYYLLTHNFTLAKDKKEIKDNTFTCLINEMGQFYSIVVYFKKRNKKVHKVTFIDSLKIIPFSVKEIAKTFKLPISKLEIDYNKERKKGWKLTLKEKEYIKNDVLIVAKALKLLFSQNLTKMTEGSNALNDYKDILGKYKFLHYFPLLDKKVDEDLRQAYRRSDLLTLILYIKTKM